MVMMSDGVGKGPQRQVTSRCQYQTGNDLYKTKGERNEWMPGLVVMDLMGVGLPGAGRVRQDLIVCTCTRQRQRIHIECLDFV